MTLAMSPSRALTRRRMLQGLAALPLGTTLEAAPTEPLPIFDAHVHYSHDAWEVVPVEQAIAIMRKAGLKRALISSSGDDGQQRLFAAAPDLVIPELRVYRSRGEIGTWFRNTYETFGLVSDRYTSCRPKTVVIPTLNACDPVTYDAENRWLWL